MPAKRKASPKDSTAHLGFEAKLWLAAESASFEKKMPCLGAKPTGLFAKSTKLGVAIGANVRGLGYE